MFKCWSKASFLLFLQATLRTLFLLIFSVKILPLRWKSIKNKKFLFKLKTWSIKVFRCIESWSFKNNMYCLFAKKTFFNKTIFFQLQKVFLNNNLSRYLSVKDKHNYILSHWERLLAGKCSTDGNTYQGSRTLSDFLFCHQKNQPLLYNPGSRYCSSHWCSDVHLLMFSDVQLPFSSTVCHLFD